MNVTDRPASASRVADSILPIPAKLAVLNHMGPILMNLYNSNHFSPKPTSKDLSLAFFFLP